MELYSLVDYFTIPPSFVAVYLNRNWLGQLAALTNSFADHLMVKVEQSVGVCVSVCLVKNQMAFDLYIFGRLMVHFYTVEIKFECQSHR